MNGLLGRYIATLGDDISSVRTDLGGLFGLARRVSANIGQRGHAFELVMSRDQREIFRSLQALMCLLEGYSNHVMDAIGRDLLPSYPIMKARFAIRLKRRGVGERLFAQLTGLDMKLEQYALGERFVNEIVAAVGIDGMARVWAGPANLPTLEEIHDPAGWIRRVSG
jgi:coenzyme F420 biosynthesis associated uncharacterized protein